MSILSLQDQHTKDLIKQALLELLEERRDLFHTLFEEVVEEAGWISIKHEKVASMEQRFAEGYAKQPQTKDEVDEWKSEQAWGEA